MKTISVYLRTSFLAVLLFFAASNTQAQRGRHYGYSYYPGRAQTFLSLPSAFLSLNFGGDPYYYGAGSFYRPYGNYYQLTAPPLGISVNVLPRGYWSFRWGGYPYYYYDGIYYRPGNNSYEVVQAPVGAEVPSIPRDAKTTVIDGEKYYEYNGTYYRDLIKPNGERWYTVEGKHGVLNTEKTAVTQNYTPSPHTAQPQDNRPAIGDVFDKLPDNYKTVVINGKKYFASSDHVYYEEVIDGNQVRYKVSGK